MKQTATILGWIVTATATPVAERWGASVVIHKRGEPLQYFLESYFDTAEAACQAGLAFGDRMILENTTY
jgi:hypothetical protein